jgi:hypothetical protein
MKIAVVAGVDWARKPGSWFSTSAMFDEACRWISCWLTTVTGVGALNPLDESRDPVTTISGEGPALDAASAPGCVAVVAALDPVDCADATDGMSATLSASRLQARPVEPS